MLNNNFAQYPIIPQKTDWTDYYGKRRLTTSVTRGITQRNLLKYLSAYAPSGGRPMLIECGGAGSCFFMAVYNHLSPQKYTVLDNNKFGLQKFLKDNEQFKGNIGVIDANMLHDCPSGEYDIVFSIGLIEHFNAEDTTRVIKAHFNLARKGGLVIIGFPTPTTQYKITRWLLERLNLWRFFDERPLQVDEVEPVFLLYGEILNKQLLRQMPLTQMLYAIKAN